MKFKIKKQKELQLEHKYCPFCGHPVIIKIHCCAFIHNFGRLYYICHDLPVKDKDGIDCILAMSIVFENKNDLIKRWESAFEKIK